MVRRADELRRHHAQQFFTRGRALVQGGEFGLPRLSASIVRHQRGATASTSAGWKQDQNNITAAAVHGRQPFRAGPNPRKLG